MDTLNSLVELVSKGRRSVESNVMVDKLYMVRCYRTGQIIRLELRSAEPMPRVHQKNRLV